jgi:serine/threonine protein kinase
MELSPGELLLDTYEVIGLVGRGGMGAVYRVYHRYLKKVMAMKTLHETQRNNISWRRFQAEAQAIARLEHLNIVQIFDMGSLDSGQLYYTMEFIKGRGLDSLIAEGMLTVNQVLAIFFRVASALAFAHERGIVHRDIKPANMVVAFDMEQPTLVKVVDFGIAKLLASEQGLTRTGEIFGSPFYMSPEQARGEKVDGRSDIYSLGCALYEALTGCVPLKGKNAMDTLTLHQLRTPLPLADLCPERVFPCGLWEVLQKMMSKTPEDRYESASQIAQDLLLISEGRGARVVARLKEQDGKTLALSPRQAAGFSGPWALRDIASAGSGTGAFGSASFGRADEHEIEIAAGQRQTRNNQAFPGIFDISNLLARPSIIVALSLVLIALGGWIWASSQAPALVQHLGLSSPLNQFDTLYSKLNHYKLERSELSALNLASSGNRQFEYYLFPTTSTLAIGRIASRLPQSQDDFSNDLPCIGLQKIPAGSKLQLVMSPYMAWHPELFQRFNANDLTAVVFPYHQKTRTKNLAIISFPSYKNAAESLKLIIALKPATRLSCLNTADVCLNEKCLSELTCFSDLAQLDMAGSDIVFEPEKLRLRVLTKLSALNLPPLDRADLILNSMVVPEQLTALTLHEFVCTENNLKAIARLKKLGYLACRDSKIEPALLQTLLRLDGLLSLDLSGSSPSSECIPLLLKMKKMETLVLSDDIEQVWGVEKFAYFRKNFSGNLELSRERIELFLGEK